MNTKPAILLREWQLSDRTSLTANANNIKVWNNVRDHFPHPYTIGDAENFIHMVTNRPHPTTEFAIVVNGRAAGGVGIVLNTDVERITAEIGYWLGESYWNKGIMTDVIRKITEYAFNQFHLKKIYAPVFDFNIASQKVLEKVGFKKEAILKSGAIKNGKIIDLHYYSLIK